MLQNLMTNGVKILGHLSAKHLLANGPQDKHASLYNIKYNKKSVMHILKHNGIICNKCQALLIWLWFCQIRAARSLKWISPE